MKILFAILNQYYIKNYIRINVCIMCSTFHTYTIRRALSNNQYLILLPELTKSRIINIINFIKEIKVNNTTKKLHYIYYPCTF
jgi:tRNA A22 N-methylase